MDFFESQERARKKTSLLVFYFGLAVATIVITIYLVLVFGGGVSSESGSISLWDPGLFAFVSVGVLVVVGLGSGFKLAQLSAGGAAVAGELGGTLIRPDTTDPVERRVLNVVEEMALASGCPVPPVYMMHEERGINAFAAGMNPSNAAIGVTRGCVESLTRDELQGVMAHEFSHILNGDMRLSTRLIGVLFGILMLTLIGRVLLRSAWFTRGGGSNRNAGPAAAFMALGLALIVVGSAGIFFGRLIKSAVSRQREFLADASAVQFTRNPEGIAGALKRIGGSQAGSRIESPKAEDASHLFFGNGLRQAMAGVFATHPPLPARIRAIEPGWNGAFLPPTVQRITGAEQRAKTGTASPPPLPFPFPGMGMPGTDALKIPGLPGAGSLVPLAAADIVIHPAEISPGALGAAAELRDLLVAKIDLYEVPTAIAVVYSMLLSDDEAVLESQLRHLETHAWDAVRDVLEHVRGTVRALDIQCKLPLVDLILPTLKTLSPEQYDRFAKNTRALIAADGQIDLFEFAASKAVLHHLDIYFERVPRARHRFASVAALKLEADTVLSALARLGRAEDASARFGRAAGSLGFGERSLLPAERCHLSAVSDSIDRLAELHPPAKKYFLLSAAELVASDGEVRPREMQLLRALGESLDTPLPPNLDRRELSARPGTVKS